MEDNVIEMVPAEAPAPTAWEALEKRITDIYAPLIDK
jgi:hypothetical protein